jgi:hypothetical protein
MKVNVYQLYDLSLIPDYIKDYLIEEFVIEGTEEKFELVGNVLVVENNGLPFFFQTDRMAPEDAYFTRDLSWIPEIIEKVYELGRKQGYDEQLEEAYNASRDFSDFKLGPAK